VAIRGDNEPKALVTILNILISVLTMTLVSVSKGGLKVAGRASLALCLAAFVLWITELFPLVGVSMTDYGSEILKRAATSNDSVLDNYLTTTSDSSY
jgi:hypothetical protein